MITFKEFLEEGLVKKWDQENLTTKKAFELLNTSHKDGLRAISNGGLLFRGDDKGGLVLRTIDPSTGTRTSKDSNNLYQLGMDRSSALQGYPSRSHSLITSTSWKAAQAYGAIYIVVPADGTTVAVYAKRDLLQHKHRGTYFASVLDFNDGMERLAKAHKVKTVGYKFADADALNKAFKYVPAEKFAISLDRLSPNELENQVQIFKKVVANRFDYIASQELTPTTLKLSLHKYGDALGAMPSAASSKECWFSAKAVLIPLEIFSEMLKELKAKGHPIHKAYKDLL